MKYLRRYNESLSNKEIKDSINDIVSDLKDDNFTVDVNIHDFSEYVRLDVFIMLYPMDDDKEFNSPVSLSVFTYSDVEKTTNHLISFLKENGYELITAHNIVNYTPVNFSFDTVKPGDKMGRFELRFNNYKFDE